MTLTQTLSSKIILQIIWNERLHFHEFLKLSNFHNSVNQIEVNNSQIAQYRCISTIFSAEKNFTIFSVKLKLAKVNNSIPMHVSAKELSQIFLSNESCRRWNWDKTFYFHEYFQPVFFNQWIFLSNCQIIVFLSCSHTYIRLLSSIQNQSKKRVK